MKHILNDLTEQEKNAIREQHTGGMKVMTEKFSKLTNSKLGDSKPLVNEQSALGAVGNGLEINGQLGNVILQTLPTTSLFNMIKSAASGDAKSFNQVLDQEKSRLGQHYQTLKNAVTGGDISKTLSNIATSLTGIAAPLIKQMQSGMGNKPQSSGGSWGDMAKGALLGVAGLNEQHEGSSNVKQNAFEMYHNNKRKLEQAIHLLEKSAEKGEDTSHYHMIIKMALREMDSFVEDLKK